MVASDRISAFDHVLETAIPDKGEILTRMSLWWFDQLGGLVQNHVVSTDVPDAVRGRAVVCERLDMYPVECVARGYLTGSVLGDYQTYGEVCGIALPAGLQDGSRLSEPIFTPATKAALGDHDENVDFESVAEQVGDDAAAELRMLTLAVYGKAEEIAREQGIILADTKFEFGRRADYTTVLADEVLTPGLLPLLAGATSGSRAASRRRTTSRSCATGCSRPSRAGTARQARPRRRCRRRSSSARGRATSRPTSASPASPGDQRNVTRGGYDMGSFTITLDLPQPPAVLFRYLADPRNRPGVAVEPAVRDRHRPRRAARGHAVARRHQGRHQAAHAAHRADPLPDALGDRHLARHRRPADPEVPQGRRGHAPDGRGPGDRPRSVRRRGGGRGPVRPGHHQGRPRAGRHRPRGSRREEDHARAARPGDGRRGHDLDVPGPRLPRRQRDDGCRDLGRHRSAGRRAGRWPCSSW